MPVTVNYPGVYIEELSSGVHTITGVATSIAAFAGWAAQGPSDQATLVLSWSDFERVFGGLDPRSLLGYSVYQFFNNGGQMAYIIRLVESGAGAGSVTLDSKLTITANSSGLWSSNYAIGIKPRSDDATRFTLTVFYVKPGGTIEVPVEIFDNLSMVPTDGRFVDTIINSDSSYIKAAAKSGETTPPGVTSPPSPKLAGGADGTVLDPILDAGTFNTALVPVSADSGVYLLEKIDLFNLLVVPGESDGTTISTLEGFCRKHRAFLIVESGQADTFSTLSTGPAGITGDDAINAAFYFPWVMAPDVLAQNRLKSFPPGGFAAGLYARTDATRGVWKAPAGTEASLTGAAGVATPLNDSENGVLNPQAINCIRNFPVYGTILWGARTLQGSDERGSEWKYVPVRRTALFLEESLYRGLKWAVFEPNDEPLWAQIRLNVGAFMHNLFRQGAFQGQTPQEAYFVKCDGESTTQNDINLGIVNVIVGFAPLKPAEFVVVKIQQMAGQIQV